MSNLTEHKSRFETVVPTVKKFPLWLLIVGSLMILMNLSFFILSLFSPQMISPILGGGGEGSRLQYMFAVRQLGIIVVFALAMYGKNTRFMQLAWFIAFLRELGDLVGALAAGINTVGVVFFIILLAVELAAFIYAGAIASGHVAKYKSQE